MSSKYEPEIIPASGDLEDWDSFVDESPQGCIFCRSWWLQAVAPDSFQILALRRGGRIVAGMPLVRRATDIVMPPLTQTLGVLLAPPFKKTYEARLSEEMDVLRELVSAIPPFGRFSVNFHYQFTNWLPFYWAGYKQTTRYTYVIDHTPLDSENLLSEVAPHCRTKIRKCEKSGLAVLEGQDLETLLSLNQMTFARQGLRVPYSEEVVIRLDRACARRNARRILLTRDLQNRIHAGLFLVYDQNTVHGVIQGSDPDLRSSGAVIFTLWHAIYSAHQQAKTFNFGGSMMENVEIVFRGFGARQIPYFSITKDNRPLPLRAVPALRAGAGRMLRRLGLRK